ncbi:hypothetical protein SLEP1_g32874 [Rubroshorea leprosula]|uniref:MBD domain-containing protein n=1 Tax=Rubroshorea leprosula TaxID=152421 RepID=A0AAV5KES9_9ROSI|nr:hypothetical protein SLEP1_g32874 [Rubroshorea leprosula]
MTSPDFLPVGWSLQSQLQKTDPEITYHANLDTALDAAQKIYSKDDLIQHMKMGNPRSNDPQPTSGQIRLSNNDHVHTVARANEHPEWLPDGWFVELKMRKSGASLGKREKSYFDPSTGFRFYSKPQVVTEKYVADELPPGWIKELKVRKSACGKKKDPYYTDPASGYVFRSKKDVFRYLETGEISRCAFLPKKRKIIDQKCTNDETTPLSAAKRHSLENGTENINNAKANSSGYSRKNKELDLPRRSSKRLAGLEPELVDIEGALQNATTKLCKIKANTIKVLVEEAAQHLKIGHRMVSAYQATVELIIQSHGDPASKSKVLPCEKAAPGLGEKPQMIETKKIQDDTSAVQTLFSSNPCMENATKKTLINAVPVKEVAHNGIVCAIPANIMREKNLGESSTSAIQPLFSSDPCLKNVTKKTPTGRVPVKEAADNGIVCAIPANILQEKNLGETSTSAVQPLFSLNPCLKNITEKKNLGESSTSAVQPHFSSDPCLKNATKKIPTGAVPVKEAADDGIVCAIPANILQEKNLSETSTSAVQHLFSSDPCLKNITKKKSIGESSTSAVQPLFSTDPCLKNLTKKTPSGAVSDKEAADNGIVCAISANILQEKNLGETSTSAVLPLFSLDPCLKNVTKKTLTGAVPVKEAADNGIVCAIPANILQMKNIGKTSMGSSAGTNTSIKKKEECHLPHQSSKRLFGLALELVGNSLSSEQDLGLATRDSCNKEATRDVGLESENLANGPEACQLVETGSVTGHRQECSNMTSVSWEYSSNKSKEPVQDQTFPADKSHKLLVTEKMYSEKSELQFSSPFANSRANSCSDPCLEFAIKTLPGATPLENAVNNQFVSASAANIQQESNIGETIMQRGSSVKTAINSSKLKKMKKNKELNLPRRSSKRLAGLTPQQVVDSFTSKEALTTAARNSCNKEAIQVAGLTSGNLANGSCQQHYPGPRTGLRHDCTYTATALHEELSTKSEELLQGQSQTAIADQCHKLDDENMPSEKSEPQIRFPFVDAWHDPCLVFAIKTLTGAIPLEDAAIDGLVSAPATNILQEKNLGEAAHGSARRVKTSLKSNKSKTKKEKELNLPHRSPKRLSRLATQLVVNSLSTEETFTVIGRNSRNEAAIRDAGSISEKLVDGACWQLETEPIMWLRNGSRYMPGALHEESSSKSKEKDNKPLQNQTVPTEHCQRPDSENIYDEKSKPQFLFPLRDSSSDPCLEFASKTLRGAVAVEDNFALQDYFQQQQLYTSSTKRDGDSALSNFGLPNFFQADISSHFDTPEKPPLWQQQVTVHPSGLPPANACLPSGSGDCSQQPCVRLRNYPAK